MPDYRLTPGQQVAVDARQLHVRAWDTRTLAPVGLRARHRSGEPAEAWTPNPERTILPAVREPVVLHAVPPPGQAAFDEDAAVSVHLQVEHDPRAERQGVLLEAVPVAGRAAPELLALEPDPPLLRVHALRTPLGEPTTGLAARVGTEARRRLGADDIPDRGRAALVVGVDVSGSMRGPLEDGSVAALVDAVAGLARVVGTGGPATAVLCGRQPRPVAVPAGTDLATAVPAELRRSGFEVGFRPSAAAPPAGSGRTVVYLVTDAEPPEPAALTADRAAWHVLVAGAPAPARGPLPCTVLEPPPAGLSATEFLLTPDGAPRLAALVSSMVTHWEGATR